MTFWNVCFKFKEFNPVAKGTFTFFLQNLRFQQMHSAICVHNSQRLCKTLSKLASGNFNARKNLEQNQKYKRVARKGQKLFPRLQIYRLIFYQFLFKNLLCRKRNVSSKIFLPIWLRKLQEALDQLSLFRARSKNTFPYKSVDLLLPGGRVSVKEEEDNRKKLSDLSSFLLFWRNNIYKTCSHKSQEASKLKIFFLQTAS